MKRVSHFSSPENPWGKSHTPKRYLNPPFSESMFTMWPNTMILLGETEDGLSPQKKGVALHHNESKLPSAAMVFHYDYRLPDSKAATYKTREDGIPIHTIMQDMGPFCTEMESFCSIDRNPTAYTKFTVRNELDTPISDRIIMTARTGSEYILLGVIEPDGYRTAEPSMRYILELPGWTQGGGRATDGTYTVYYRASENVELDERSPLGVLLDISLKPGEEAVIYFAFGRGNTSPDFSYEEEKEKTIAFWEGELSRIRLFPKKEDPFFYAMYRSLVSQGLQMFTYAKDSEFVRLRQGGLQRLMWPADVRSMIRALARIGDFEVYLDAILNTYFNMLQKESGEVITIGIPWGGVTGSVLFAFGACAKYNQNLYEKYKDRAYHAFRWIEEQRAMSTKDPSLASGLFIPYRNSDYPADGQMWQVTDVFNIHGYVLYLQGLKANADPKAEEVKSALNEYMEAMKRVANKAVEACKDSDALILPHDARMDPEIEERMRKGVLGENSNFWVLNLGVLGFDTDAAKKLLHTRMTLNNEYKNGTVCPFSVSPANRKHGRRWYGSWTDMELYYYCRRTGNDEMAKEILDAQINYHMTNEFYMMERYDDSDPYYAPWCPNCSANGRTISMLCDWYVERESEEL